LFLGVLAAGAVSAFAERVRAISAEWVPPRPGLWLRLATLLPVILVLVEGLNATPHPVVPRQPEAMRVVDGPLLVLPSDQNTDQNVMLWSTTAFQPIVNGGSGFTPRSLAEMRQVTESFPDAVSVAYLRERGVRAVILLRDRAKGTKWEEVANRSVESLDIQREELGSTVIFRL
ncbi:MAG: hypothetical protein DIU79_08735, partial [Actinobacteria bacterium]